MSIRKYFKRLGRKTAKFHVKSNRVFTTIGAAGATVLVGPLGGAAVTALGAEGGRYFRATQARAEGQRGLVARDRGRGERKRVGIYGGIGTAVGAAGSGTYTAASGGTVGDVVGTTLAGQAGYTWLGGTSPMFTTATEETARNFGTSTFVTYGNLAGQPYTGGVPGVVTQGTLASAPSSSVPGLVSSLPAADAAAVSGGGTVDTLTKIVGALNAADRVYGAARGAGGPTGSPISPAYSDLGLGGPGGDMPGGGGASGLLDWLGGGQQQTQEGGGGGALLLFGALLLLAS